MKKVTLYGVGMTSIFYLSIGGVGYGAFGNEAPGNLLTGFADFEPFWLVDVANLCLVIHLIGAYQVQNKQVDYYFLENQIAILSLKLNQPPRYFLNHAMLASKNKSP